MGILNYLFPSVSKYLKFSFWFSLSSNVCFKIIRLLEVSWRFGHVAHKYILEKEKTAWSRFPKHHHKPAFIKHIFWVVHQDPFWGSKLRDSVSTTENHPADNQRKRVKKDITLGTGSSELTKGCLLKHILQTHLLSAFEKMQTRPFLELKMLDFQQGTFLRRCYLVPETQEMTWLEPAWG